MNSGKKQQSQKTREPYGKVTEVGQVPVALQEIKEINFQMCQEISRDGVVKSTTTPFVVSRLIDSIITVTCANPGCLSQMAEGLQIRGIGLRPSFTCHGCNAEIVIDKDNPKCRMFEWTDVKTCQKNPYCYDCDDILIQDGDLPNAKKKMEVQS